MALVSTQTTARARKSRRTWASISLRSACTPLRRSVFLISNLCRPTSPQMIGTPLLVMTSSLLPMYSIILLTIEVLVLRFRNYARRLSRGEFSLLPTCFRCTRFKRMHMFDCARTVNTSLLLRQLGLSIRHIEPIFFALQPPISFPHASWSHRIYSLAWKATLRSMAWRPIEVICARSLGWLNRRFSSVAFPRLPTR